MTTSGAHALLSLLALAAIAAPTIYLWRRAAFARSELRRLYQLQIWRARFQEKALLLVDAESLPAARLDFVRSRSEWMDEPRMAPLVLEALQRTIDERSTDERSIETTDEPLTLFGEPCDNHFYAETFVQASLAFMMAVSFASPVHGPKIHEAIAELFALRIPGDVERVTNRIAVQDAELTNGLPLAA